jgi:hypothetical protein
MTRREREADLEQLKKRLASRAPAKPAAPKPPPKPPPPPEPEPEPPVSFEEEMARQGIAPSGASGADRVSVRPSPPGPRRDAGGEEDPPPGLDDDASWEHATRGVLARDRGVARGPRERVASLPTLDLHGFSEDDALAELGRFLELHRREEPRWVRVITGRGRHGSAVLRRAASRRLQASPAVAAVRPAEPADGGEGVLLVQLRRARPG